MASQQKQHAVVQGGRDYWRPHTELQRLRDRIEGLEIDAETCAKEVALLTEALRSALALVNGYEKRIASLEAMLAGEVAPA